MGGNGVYTGPDGEPCIIDAVATISSKTKTLYDQDQELERRLLDQASHLADLQKRFGNASPSPDDIQRMIEKEIAQDKSNVQHLVRKELKLASVSILEESSR